MQRRLTTVLPAAAVAFGLTGCGVQPGSVPAAQTSLGSSSASVSASASPAAVGSPDPLPELASVAGDLAGVRMTLNALRRAERDTLTLIFTLSNDSTRSVVYSVLFSEGGFSNPHDPQSFDVSGAYLVDGKNRRKHLVLRDTDRRCLCSAGLVTSPLAPGAEAVLFAKFAAPAADVTALNVVVPHFPVIEGVQIS